MKKYVPIFFLMFIFASLFNGCDITDNLTDKADTPSTTLDNYFYVADDSVKLITLKTIQEWEGNKSDRLLFSTDYSPWIINCGYTVTSKLANNFEVTIVRYLGEGGEWVNTDKLSTGEIVALVNSSGDYEIVVESSGCEWWIRIGVE